MIDDVLHKFTLSEARRPTRSRIQIQTTPKKTNLKTSSHKVSTFNASCNHRPTPLKVPIVPKNKLQRMIEFLQEHSCLKCSIKEHQSSKIRYVCLQDSCNSNLGCAYCFLHSHVGHKKAQIQICIRDISDLNNLLNKSYDKITSSKLKLRNQMLTEIDLEINNLINEFHSNIQFLKNKAIKQIDNLLLQSSAPLTNLHETYPMKDFDEQLLTEIIRLDVKGMERDLYYQLQDIEYQKMSALPIRKIFQEINSTMGHIMAEFKKQFPKLHSPVYWNMLVEENLKLKQKQNRINRQYREQDFDDNRFENIAFESPHFQS